jgi:cytochrome c553
VPFLTIPGLDVETLRERNAAIGEWPEDSDAELTPFMAMLLRGPALTKEHLAMIGKRDLLDLSDASDADIAAVERLAWAIKSLIFDMSTKDPAFLTQILSAGNRSGDIPVGRLIAAMPRDVMLGARRDWLPNLARELADHKAGKRVLASGAFVEKRSAKQLESAPSISDTAAAAAAKNDILSDTAADKGKSDILSGDKSDILSGDKSDILSGDKSDILSGDKSDILSDDKSDILSDGSDDVSSLQVDSPPPTAEPEVDEEKFARLGGWYRRDFGIFFHPTGHEDGFLISWLDYAGRNAGDDNAGEAVFKSLSGKNAQGGCVKCHSVDAIPGGGKQVNWAPSGVKQAKQRLTAFSHAPHFSVVGPKGCLTCHQIDGKAKYQDTYSQPDAAQFASNFTSVSLATCSECHNPKFAGETCLTCHNYHAGMIETPFLTTQIPSQKP